MRRGASNFFAATSLLALVLSIGYWIAGYQVTDFYFFGSGCGPGVELASGNGRIFVGAWSRSDHPVTYRHEFTLPNWKFVEIDHCEHVWYAGPVTFVRESRYDLHNFVGVRLPARMLAIAFGVLPVVWLVRRGRSGPQPGHCAVCGYDLRATPERCPECGATSAAAGGM